MSTLKESVAPKPRTCSRLAFLKSFLDIAGLDYKATAELLQFSGPSVRSWFITDNVKFSYISEIVAKCNETLPLFKDNPWQFRANIILPEDAKGTVDYSKYFNNFGEQRLLFVWVAVKRVGITLSELAERLGVTYASVRYWKNQDDITTNDLYRIVYAIGGRLEFVFEPAVEPTPKKFPSIDYSIRFRKTCEIAPPEEEGETCK